METNEQGLTKEEKIMFLILGIILLVAIGVLIINSFSKKDTNLDNNETPITETSGKGENIVDDNTNEPEDILIEEESDDDIVIYPVVNIPSSSGNEEDQSIPKPKPQPVVLDWNFKSTMVTTAYSNDVITIEQNVLLTNGEEAAANVVVMRYDNNAWISQDISDGTFTVQEGLYKYVYSYGSSTKELLLTVSNKLTLDTLSILELNETLNENSSITIEEFTKYQTIISNTILSTEESVNNLTINNYIDTNNLLPLVITTNEDLTNKTISTNTLGITITKEQNDWHNELTPNSIIMWLDLNTIDITNNIIILDIDGVSYNLELNITINQETLDTEDSELENDKVEEDTDNENDESNEDNSNEETSNEDDTSNVEDNSTENEDEEIVDNEETEDNEEEDLDPLEPTEEDITENSSEETSSPEEQIQDTNLEPAEDNMSNTTT